MRGGLRTSVIMSIKFNKRLTYIHMLIFAVWCKRYKIEMMVKVLYSLRPSGVRGRLQTSSVALDPIWIMPECCMPCSGGRMTACCGMYCGFYLAFIIVLL